jgi:hypothetical protein
MTNQFDDNVHHHSCMCALSAIRFTNHCLTSIAHMLESACSCLPPKVHTFSQFVNHIRRSPTRFLLSLFHGCHTLFDAVLLISDLKEKASRHVNFASVFVHSGQGGRDIHGLVAQFTHVSFFCLKENRIFVFVFGRRARCLALMSGVQSKQPQPSAEILKP